MTTALFESKTVGELVGERIGRASLFEKLGVDFCCNGHNLLPVACEKAGVELENVCSLLEQSDLAAEATNETDWTSISATELADHIVSTHHAYLKEALPQVERLVEKVARVHGGNHPELVSMREVYAGLKQELDTHMMKEEQILFPMIKALEKAVKEQSKPEAFHCGSVNNPIRMMEHEHDIAGNALRQLRELSKDYLLPEGACNTYQLLFNQLQELEKDLHIHIHKENNILFPAGSKMEQQLGII